MTTCRRMLPVAAITLAALLAAIIPGHAQHAQFYVLDGFGGVHAGGGAPAVSPATPYFGFDIARDIAFIPVGNAAVDGNGVLVLDGFGGIHTGGALRFSPPTGGTPYFGFDAARAITYRLVPSRVAAAAPETTATISVTPPSSVRTILSVDVFAPDDGFLVVQGTVTLNCPSSVGDVVGRTSLNVDSATIDSSFANYYSVLRDCEDTANGFPPRDNVTLQKTYAVGAGQHTANLLVQFTARSTGGSLQWDSPHLTVTFVDQDFEGASAPSRGSTISGASAATAGPGS